MRGWDWGKDGGYISLVAKFESFSGEKRETETDRHAHRGKDRQMYSRQLEKQNGRGGDRGVARERDSQRMGGEEERERENGRGGDRGVARERDRQSENGMGGGEREREWQRR